MVYALETMRRGKAASSDQITIELIKFFDDVIDIFLGLFNRIYDKGEEVSKLNPRKSSDYRTIALMSHLEVVLIRSFIKKFTED